MKYSGKIENMTADVFAERLRKALRMDPDCILLGEIRDAMAFIALLAVYDAMGR